MKPRSTSPKNFMRRFYRRYDRQLKQSDHLKHLYEIDGFRKHSEVLERMALWFFVCGTKVGLEYGKSILSQYDQSNFSGSNPQTNYAQFHARDVPIFLDPEIMDLFQQTSNDKEIFENGKHEHVRT